MIEAARPGARHACRSGAVRLGLWPERLTANTAYGSAEMLDWLVHERGIEPHIPVFDKSNRGDATFSRSDFAYDRPRRACRSWSRRLASGSI